MRLGRLLAGVLTILLATSSGAAAASIYAIRDNTRELIRIDPVTLAVSVVGATGVPAGTFGDLAYDETAGIMYWLAGRGNNSLYTVNLATGAATLVGAHGINNAFALGHNGTGLFGQADNGSVYTFNAGTGSATPIGSNGVYPGGYDWNSATGQMVFTQAGLDQFYSVDLTTGATTLLGGSGGGLNDNDLAYDADRNVYWVADFSGQLWRYDSLFVRTLMLSGLGSMASIEYVADQQVAAVPEPASMLLIGTGLAALFIRRRRRS